MTEPKCPLFKKPCLKHGCTWWVQLDFAIEAGHPNTGEKISKWDCAINWNVITNIEAGKQTAQVGAAVESLRNEMVKRQNALAGMIEMAVREEPDGEKVYELDAGEVGKLIGGNADENTPVDDGSPALISERGRLEE